MLVIFSSSGEIGCQSSALTVAAFHIPAEAAMTEAAQILTNRRFFTGFLLEFAEVGSDASAAAGADTRAQCAPSGHTSVHTTTARDWVRHRTC